MTPGLKVALIFLAVAVPLIIIKNVVMYALN